MFRLLVASVGSWELVVETGVMTYSGGFARLLGLSPGEAMSELVPGGDGRAAYMRGTVLDVTDTRVAERERLEAVTLFQQGFDAAPIGMVLTDPLQGRYVRVNDAMCRLLDRSRESLIGVEHRRRHPSRRSWRRSAIPTRDAGRHPDGSRPSSATCARLARSSG